jgi:hypothetical protein
MAFGLFFQGNPYRLMMMNKEDNICWFHGKVSREVAEQILINGNVEFKNLFAPNTLKK